MSVLQTPRVYFKGHITWDPIVTNNYRKFYDERTARPVFGGGNVASYRESARQAVTSGNWNPHGTHRSTLYETTVVGADLGEGIVDHDDAFVGVPVSFCGMLVDLDPYGATSSQLFFDAMSFGIPGGCRIHGPRTHRFTARRINFTRNPGNPVIAGVASVIWQASFAKRDGLSLDPRDSKILDAVKQALGRDDVLGLTVRMNTYRTNYYGAETISPAAEQALADRIAAGGFHPNPARSLVVGTVGLWCDGEPPCEPGDRLLIPTSSGELGTACARVEPGRLVIDLANSTPEVDYQATKKDLGRLSVVARSGTSTVALGELAPTDYDRIAYERSAGIVVLPLTDTQQQAAESGDLALSSTTGTQLQETPLLATSDVPNLYLESGEQQPVTIRVLERGRVPGRSVKVTVADLQGDPIQPTVLSTDAEGVATLPLQGGRGGEWTWVLLPWTDSTPPPVPTQQTFSPEVHAYVSMRTLPADDDVAALEPTWANVHQQVLRGWEAMAPCMDNWLRLGDEAQCRTYAPLIRRLTDPGRIESFSYMPVTRDLTPGQRTLLHRWCDAVTTPRAPASLGLAAPSAPETTAPTRRPRGMDFHRSFKGRGGPRGA